MGIDVDVALMNQPMLFQVLKDIHDGLFAVMVIENFVTQAFRIRVIQAAQDFSLSSALIAMRSPRAYAKLMTVIQMTSACEGVPHIFWSTFIARIAGLCSTSMFEARVSCRFGSTYVKISYSRHLIF